MTPIPKWRRLSFGCGLLFRERLNCAWVGAGFGSAEEIPGRRAFPLGCRCAPPFEETSRLPGTLGRPSLQARCRAQFAVVRLPPPTRTTVARRPCRRATADRPARAHAVTTQPHSILADPRAWSRATPVRAAGAAAERVRKPTRFSRFGASAPGREKCSANRISTRRRGQHRGRLRQHPSAVPTSP